MIEGKKIPDRSNSQSNNAFMGFKFTVRDVLVTVKLGQMPKITVSGNCIFSASDLDNNEWREQLKRGELPPHVEKRICREIELMTGNSIEAHEVQEAYRQTITSVKSGKPDTHTIKKVKNNNAELNPKSWFTDDKHAEFVPYKCARDYLRVYPHVVTEYLGTIHQFTGKYYLKNAEGTIRTNIENAGAGIIKPKNINEAVESLTNLTRIIDPDKIDMPMEKIMPLPDYVIPLEDGLLNLMTKKIVSHSPRYFYTEYLPRHYIPGSKPEVFISFLNSLFLDDPNANLKKKQIFEIIAWTLTDNYSIQGAVILYGQGGEGKSIFHSIIGDLLVHVTSLTLAELESDKFKRAELHGSWANLISENSSEIITSEWFKRLTDGTTITVDRKNGHPFQMASRAKLILDVNELPNKEKELRAFYRRVIAIIDFPNLLESVLTPVQISEFVQKMKDPTELDRIFSYTIDRFYGPLVSRMKFTGQLSIAEAEQKWEERSNPAKSYLEIKNNAGEILTDIDRVRELLKGDMDSEKRYITKENSGEEYLTMVKADVIADAVKWATSKGFPAKTIHGGTMGAALISMGFHNQTVSKKVGKGTVLKAWRDVYIHIGSGQVTGRRNPQLPLKNQFMIDEVQSGNGSFPLPVHAHTHMREYIEASVTKVQKPLKTTGEKQVAGIFHDPLPEPLTHDAETKDSYENPNVRKEKDPESKESITESDGNLVRDQFLKLSYVLDPNCGPDINRKYYKIGISGRQLTGDRKEKFLNIMEKESFKQISTGAHGTFWFTRPLNEKGGISDPTKAL